MKRTNPLSKNSEVDFSGFHGPHEMMAHEFDTSVLQQLLTEIKFQLDLLDNACDFSSIVLSSEDGSVCPLRLQWVPVPLLGLPHNEKSHQKKTSVLDAH